MKTSERTDGIRVLTQAELMRVGGGKDATIGELKLQLAEKTVEVGLAEVTVAVLKVAVQVQGMF